MISTTSTTSGLLTAFLIDIGIQFVFYLISASLKTERFYDVSAMLTYVSIISTLLGISNSNSPLSSRQIILGLFGLLWTTRLGIFLFIRVLSHRDARFDELKKSFAAFAVPWIAQVVWIYLSPLGIYVVISNRGADQSGLIWSDIIGIIVFIFGFCVETLADYQKQVFKTANPKDFITSGIWAYSRYANYFGEVVLWYGIFILAAAGVAEPWQWIIVLSPLFVTLLLVKGSGVALSEKGAQSRYGDREDFKAYCARTSKFFPWFPKSPPA